MNRKGEITPRHMRQGWAPRKGRAVLNFNWDAINVRSVVHVSASEVIRPEVTGENFRRFVGAATVRVCNVSPHSNPGGVTFVVEIDWGDPIPIVTDITLFDELPEQTLFQ
jgi:hypothetical protein